jgi:uncharacterized membrane protein
LVLTGVFASLSFGAIQIRIANTLYGLALPFPCLVLPLTLSVVLSNLIFGGLGIVDIIFGSLTTLITTYLISKCKKPILIIPIIILVVSTGISLYLSQLIKVPFLVLFFQIALGQIIPATLSYSIVKRIKNVFVC